jgi:hypothetical protein
MGVNSPYIYFKSRMRPVHRFHWDLFFDAHHFLPEPPQQVVASILRDPPSWYVIDKTSLARLTEYKGTESGKAAVAQGLEASGLYQPVLSTDRYLIRRLRGRGVIETDPARRVSTGTP